MKNEKKLTPFGLQRQILPSITRIQNVILDFCYQLSVSHNDLRSDFH